MKYISRGINLDEDVWRELSKLRKTYGSYNKGLRAILLAKFVTKDLPEAIIPPRPASLDAYGPEISSGRGKAVIETRQESVKDLKIEYDGES